MNLEGIQLHTHSSVDINTFTHLYKLHNAIDTILSLHFANHTQLIGIKDVFKRTSHLLNRELDLYLFLCLFLIDPKVYRIMPPTKGWRGDGIDWAACQIGLFEPIGKFNLSLQSRRHKFVLAINDWIDSNQHAERITPAELNDIVELNTNRNKAVSPSKVTKPKSLTLKNDSSKFKFKPKDEKTQQINNNGLSLLERIKLKESRAKQQTEIETPGQKRNAYLEGKLLQIYNIIAQITGENNHQMKSYPLTKLTQLIKDSLNYPIHEDEIHDCLQLLQAKLSQTALTITTRNDLSVVKVYRLDRANDVKLLT